MQSCCFARLNIASTKCKLLILDFIRVDAHAAALITTEDIFLYDVDQQFKRIVEDDEEEEEFEHFDDFTLASSWERFISEIEAVCRQWLADGPRIYWLWIYVGQLTSNDIYKVQIAYNSQGRIFFLAYDALWTHLMRCVTFLHGNIATIWFRSHFTVKDAVQINHLKDLYKVKSEFKCYEKLLHGVLFAPSNDGKGADWDQTLHDLQLCFGVKEFLVIAPQSASGVVLDAPEASKLLSAVAIALSNCSCLWPAFVPVHDPSRKAYIGIQNMGTVFTRRFEADRIGSQVPIKLMHLEGLYELFVSKFTIYTPFFKYILKAYTAVDWSMHHFEVHFKLKLTYKTPTYDDEDELQEPDIDVRGSSENIETETHGKTQWDDDCPWSKWYSAEDLVKGFELLAIWSEITAESSLDMAELENASPLEADKWFLYPCLSENLAISDGRAIGFASQLHLLVKALEMSSEAKFIEDFVSVENSGSENLKSSAVVPPPTVLDRVLKDLFHEVTEAQPDSSLSEHKSSRSIKGAPLESLFAQFCLHALWFGNCSIRAIAVLWIEFVREVRWCWEESQPLPRMPTNGTIDLSTCLINQKLHMLAVCIDKKRREVKGQYDGTNDPLTSRAQEDLQVPMEFSASHGVSEGFGKKLDSPRHPFLSGISLNTILASLRTPHFAYNKISLVLRKNYNMSSDVGLHLNSLYPIGSPKSGNLGLLVWNGSSGVAGSMMLLKARKIMHAPITQDPPLMTEDMHEERLRAAVALGDSFSFSGQLERDILASDMSAFKAANPEAVFEDFIRWHSPKDWEKTIPSRLECLKLMQRKCQKSSGLLLEDFQRECLILGTHGERSGTKLCLLPASQQKPLLDPNREGEKVLHYLETLRPYQLLEQMVCTAFKAAADTLYQTSFGNLKQMTTKIGQLYVTMASTLKYFQSHSTISDSDVIEDLRRLCTTFGHIEKLILLAASLHRKFLQSPHLAEAIFSDCYDYYLPNMEQALQKEFDRRQQVSLRDRNLIIGMFPPPTANQSWRKVLSMGNLLNGHEPILREIIFSKRDHVSGSYYSAPTPNLFQQDIETYRMYVCGTPNDLRVALAVTSFD
ncbi:Rab3 GTPase-activating protein catalytic subunit [Sesamum angolense]|uniref:Rab3 GTPase-activating protein catalytic subunit n=1 Tax=Sesamum angolense TaxID=2727404 RepID=A0AAE1X2D0_9LAMI|nr:Rab3 GTPase-activating protein catalytic subunit [Sesamum angolense]